MGTSPVNPLDVLVIGGGATGCGVALDAATRGLRVGLVEREDFSSGTSSRSTKLIHGGKHTGTDRKLSISLEHEIDSQTTRPPPIVPATTSPTLAHHSPDAQGSTSAVQCSPQDISTQPSC